MKSRVSDASSKLDRWAARSILGLTHVLVVITPLTFTWFNEELFEFNKMLVVYIITLLMTAAWLTRRVLRSPFELRASWLDISVLLFVVSQILSTVLSLHPRTSLLGYYTRFHGGLLSTFAYSMLYVVVRTTITTKHIRQVLWSVVIGATLASLYAIPEHFGHSPSCYLITGSFDTACWVQDVQSRVFGTFGQPNWLAAYLILALPLALSLLQTTQKTVQKLAFSFSSMLLIMALVFTSSRSGVLGLLGGLGIFALGSLWLHIPRKKQTPAQLQSLGRKHAWLLGTLVAIIGIFAWFGSPFTPALSTRLGSTGTPTPEATVAPVVLNRLDVGGTDSGDIRKIVWQGAIDIWKRYPVVGSGVETFAYSYYLDRPAAHNTVSEWDFLYNKAHNEFLNFLATTGAVGLLSYIMLLTSFMGTAAYGIWKSGQSSSTDREASTLALGLLSGLVALTISNFFGFSTVMVAAGMYLYFALIYMLVKDAYPGLPSFKEYSLTAGSAKVTRVPLTLGTTVLLTLLAIATLFGLHRIVQTWRADVAFATGKQYVAVGRLSEGAHFLKIATQTSPREAVFYDELGTTYAHFARAYASDQQATQAAEFSQAALDANTLALRLNPAHLNFYKTRARILIQLSQLQPSLLGEAEATLLTAIERSPTDAKLWYNLGLVQISQEKSELGVASLERSLELKPDYDTARIALAEHYQRQGNIPQARELLRHILEVTNPGDANVQQKLEALDDLEETN